MMTREDASEILSDEEISCLIGKFHGAKEALDLALTALRPVSREQVEKVWPGCPYCKEGIYSDFAYDKMCRSQDGIYCKFCGKPMTDDAVQMAMERLEALKDV